MKMRFIVFAALLGICTIASADRADAAKSCSISSATMTFGSFDVYGPALQVNGTISMSCTVSGAATATPLAKLKKGTGTIADRYMICTSGACVGGAFAADQLHYNLYTDATYATVWGTSPGYASTPATCSNATCAMTWTIFGLIPAAIAGGTNDVAVGGYTDSVVVAVSY